MKVFSTGAGKVIVIGAITLGLMIPLLMLRGLIAERTSMRDRAHAAVAQGWGGALVTGAPMLVVPLDRAERNDKGERSTLRRHLYVLPTHVHIDVELIEQADRRRIGIYEVPVYLARAKISGEFPADAALAAATNTQADAVYHYARSRLRLPLSDTRALRELSSTTVNGRSLAFAPARPGLYGGIEADIDVSAAQGKPISFEFTMTLAGSRSFSLLPLAATTRATMRSAWPHPKFVGAFLPATRGIDDGFTASWQVLELNRSYGQSWLDCDLNEERLLQASFGVELFQSVDIYQRSERAVKYALLFIALTFLSFFAWEQVSKVAVHPIQYLLIGLALSVFYLLLIALTEHIAFAFAYWIAAAALVSLLIAYTSAALQGFKRGVAVGGAMTLTYTVLYMLVLSEQYALLMGAIALFIALSIVMLATRRVRWYREM